MKISPNPRSFHYSLGERGEAAAAEFLRKLGFKILFKNYKCPIGEIDLIAEKAGQIHFIEVKTRSSLKSGDPAEAVDLKKQAKLVKLTEWYLKEKKITEASVSFDVVAVLMPDGQTPEVKLIENAFEKTDERY